MVKWMGGDAPVIGATVKATCSDGTTTQVVTDTNGHYTISGFAAGSKCRIEVDPSSAGVGSGSNGVGNSAPLVDIVKDGETHDVSTGSPATYCQENPDIFYVGTPGYYQPGNNNNGVHTGGGSAAPNNFGTIFTVPTPAIGKFNNNSTIKNKRTLLTTHSQTGAIWGLAFKRGTRELFASSSIKRFVPLKDESSVQAVKDSLGRIWKVKLKSDGTTDTISEFVKVPNVISDADAQKLTNRNYGVDRDRDVANLIGKIGLGDIDISEDETTLYTVNMHQKKLVKIDIASQNITQIDIPNPYSNSECDDEHVRPWAVKARGGDVFIGSVCDNKIASGVGAAIQKYSNGTFTTIAKTNSLKYARPAHYGPKDRTPIYYNNWGSGDDSPILTDIEFTNRGDLVLGYTNRSAYNRDQALGGDIRKMCVNPDGSYTDESTEIANTNCATHKLTYGDYDYYEFYTGDYFGGNYGASGHPDTASGALAQAPGAPNIIVGMVDGTDWWQPGAIGLYSNTSGDKIGAQAAIDNTINNDTGANGGSERKPFAGKQGGMGDVELLCDPSPIEIGNLVWMDINQNGIQDANEPPMPNVPVELYCQENGSYVSYGTATTDSKGHFYFGGMSDVNLKDGKKITAGLNCKLKVAKSDVNGKPATKANVNNDANDTIDNDAVEDGEFNVISFTTSLKNNHDLDFGIQPALGCVSGVLFEDVNNDGNQDNTDLLAPAGITVIATDTYGNKYTTVTDSNGSYTFCPIVVGKVKIDVDTTDTDIPEGAVFADKNKTVTVVETECNNSCSVAKFLYTLPSPKDQDPASSATCANPTSLTWEGATVGSQTVWYNPDVGENGKLTFTTAGGSTVTGTMKIINNNDGEYNQASSGTDDDDNTTQAYGAFGQPYLTLYLGDQNSPGDGDWQNSDNAGCAAHGYDLEAGESYQLEVTFDEPVILDNWRIRDVDSGDRRNNQSNWEWQDAIKVEAFDANGTPVEIETKIGDSGVGLIVDNNGLVHTDKDNYDAGSGDFATGDGTSPNSTNGHIVLTSNFKPIKKLVITHSAGPDMPCQTRSALAMAGFAVCKPLKISGTVYDDKDGSNHNANTCNVNDEKSIGGTPISSVEGKALNACLLDSNGKVLDTMPLVNGSYEFNKFIKPNSDYKVIVTTNICVPGEAAPATTLAENWYYEGEKIDPANNCGDDGNDDGKIDVHVASSDVEKVDFAINKRPTATDYTRPLKINPGDNNEVDFVFGQCQNDYINDFEQNGTISKIRVISISGGTIKHGGTVISEGNIIDTIDFCSLKVDPDSEDDTIVSMTYKAVDEAGRESDLAIFKVPFKSLRISGHLHLDKTNNNIVDGDTQGKACDNNTQLYAILLDKDGNMLSSYQLEDDGTYEFRGSDGVRKDSNYTVIISTDSNSVEPSITANCWFEYGEKIDPANNSGNDGNADGKIDVQVAQKDVENVDLSITPAVEIGNRVWLEDDNDGDANTGNVSAVKNVVVTAKCANNKEYNATTDNNGEYTINVPVDIGECNVTLDRDTLKKYYPSKGSDDSNVEDNVSEDNKTHNPDGTVLDVAQNDNLTVDFALVEPACLGSKVWLDKNGNGVYDEGEEPISDVNITVYLDENGSEVAKDINGSEARTVTDENGSYQVCGLKPGVDYYVGFKAPKKDGAPLFTTKRDGDNNDANNSDVPEFENGEVITKDPVSLNAGQNYAVLYAGYVQDVCIGNVVWYDENLNGIQNEDMSKYAVANVTVHIYDVNGNPVKDTQGNIIEAVKTDSNGRYAFCHVKPGQDYKIKFDLPEGYRAIPKDQGSDKLDSDADDNSVILVKSNELMKSVEPFNFKGQNTIINSTYDIGIYCDHCQNYKVHPEEKREFSASAFNIAGVLMLLLTFILFSRRERD